MSIPVSGGVTRMISIRSRCSRLLLPPTPRRRPAAASWQRFNPEPDQPASRHRTPPAFSGSSLPQLEAIFNPLRPGLAAKSEERQRDHDEDGPDERPCERISEPRCDPGKDQRHHDAAEERYAVDP